MEISIKELTKVYNKQIALDNITVSINQGEVIGLLGPNGAGKSTLMKCITGSLQPTNGIIKIDNKNIDQHPIETKKIIGYLPENNPLYQDMFVKEYLTFVANIRKIPTQEIHNVIESVGLTAEQSKKIKDLSKGYKQRVGLAQAIIHKPEILILDEPTNGLDPNQIIEIRNLIKEVGHNKTVILSTHIMQEVSALCTRVILLNNGKIVADQPITEFQGSYNTLEDAFQNLTQ